MIIVSQERDTVVNFDNVQAINIHMQNRNEICAWFDSNENNRNSVLLGTYENEERCKEVLHEMFNYLTAANIFSGSIDTQKAMAYAAVQQYKVYAMPEK